MNDATDRGLVEALDLARVADDQLAAASDLRVDRGRVGRLLELVGLTLSRDGRPSRPHPESVRRAAEALDELATCCASIDRAAVAAAASGSETWGDELWSDRIDGWEARRRVDRLVGVLERELLARRGEG